MKSCFYIEDLERIVSVAKLHRSINEKLGINPLCSMNVIDSKGQPLGTVHSDTNGNTCFSEIGVRQR